MPAPRWTHRLRAAAAGVSLARESGHVLAWDVNRWLVLLDSQGRVQAQTQVEGGIAAAEIADDGSAVADADDRGTVSLRSPDLAPRWRQRVPRRPTALALDALGRALAVGDTSGRLWFFSATGPTPEPPVTLPRPAHHLAFAPTAPALFATADFGLVACVDIGQRRAAWQDAPVVHLGSLAAIGNPAGAVVASFSEGLRRYALAGQSLPAVPTPEPCRFVAATYAGDRFLVGGVFGGLHLLTSDGAVLAAEKMDQPVAGVTLAPLGETAVVALADGRVVSIAYS